jgi:hypothetical protein
MRGIAVTTSAEGMRRWWIWLAASGGVLLLLAFCLDRGTYPSRQAAENLLRYAIDGSWQVLRQDGAVEALRDEDIASIEGVDCQKDRRLKSDFPLFACVFNFAATNGQRYIAVVGALYWRAPPDMPTVDDYIVYAWSIGDQKAVLDARGIAVP